MNNLQLGTSTKTNQAFYTLLSLVVFPILTVRSFKKIIWDQGGFEEVSIVDKKTYRKVSVYNFWCKKESLK